MNVVKLCARCFFEYLCYEVLCLFLLLNFVKNFLILSVLSRAL
jgi:hypothetical protein